MATQYKIPDDISQECKHLLSRIFVTDPAKRITLKEIKNHPWYLNNLPNELSETDQAVYYKRDNTSYYLQSIEDIMKIVGEARKPVASSSGSGDEDEEEEEEEGEDEYEEHVKEAHSCQEPQDA